MLSYIQQWDRQLQRLSSHRAMKALYPMLFSLLGIQANAQSFYITSYDYSTYLNTISSIDADLNVTPIASLYFNGDQIWDIAFASDGKLYGTTSYALIEINLQAGIYTEVYEFPVTGQYNSLVCNSDNEIITLEYNNHHLITIDLSNFTEVSNVVLDESSPGDLTFYKGDLIFQGTSSNAILSVRGTTLITLACPIASPSGEPFLFYGFSNYTDSCEADLVYGFSQDGHVYRHDIEAQTNAEVGTLANSPQPINGSTTLNEWMASGCSSIELDEVSCTVQMREQQLSDVLLYPNPVVDVLHVQGLALQGELLFALHSLDGRKLIEGVLTPEMDLSQFASGVYLMDIYNSSRTLSSTRRIITN